MSFTPKPQEAKDPEETNPSLSRRLLIGGAAVGGLGLAATALKSVLPEEAAAQSLPDSCFFALQIEGFFNATFPHVSGLGSETELKETGGSDPLIRKVEGRLKWSDIELKRGITTNLDIYEWRKAVEDGDFLETRKNGSIVLYGQDRTEVARWNFTNGWPSKVHISSLDEGGAGCAWEILTLQVESVRRVTPPR